MTSEQLQDQLGFVRAELTISVRGDHHVEIFVPLNDVPYSELYEGFLSGPEWASETNVDVIYFDRKADADKPIAMVNKEWDKHKRRRLDGGFYTEVNGDGYSVGHDDEDVLYQFETHWYESRTGAEREAREIMESEAYLSWKNDAPRRDALKRYSAIKDELMEYTDRFHDAMLYDIEGYNSEESDADDIKDLIVQVDAFESILKGFKTLKYKFG